MVLVHKKKSKTKFGVARSRDTTRSHGRGRKSNNISKSSRGKFKRSGKKMARRFTTINLKKEWFGADIRHLTECIRRFIFNYMFLMPQLGSFESMIYNINSISRHINFRVSQQFSNDYIKLTNISDVNIFPGSEFSYSYGSVLLTRDQNGVSYTNSPGYRSLIQSFNRVREHGWNKAIGDVYSTTKYITVSVYNLYFNNLWFDQVSGAWVGHVTTLICTSLFGGRGGEMVEEDHRIFSYDSGVNIDQNDTIQQTLTTLEYELKNEFGCTSDNNNCQFTMLQNTFNIQSRVSRKYLRGTDNLCQSLAYMITIKTFTDNTIVELILNNEWDQLVLYIKDYFRRVGVLEVLSQTYEYVLNAIDGGVRNSRQLRALIRQYNINPKDIVDREKLSAHCLLLSRGQQNFGKSKKTSSEQQQRQCPKEPAKLFNLGTKKLGLNKKYWKVVKDKKGIKRWVLYAKKTTR
jgi:hypothetical protein